MTPERIKELRALVAEAFPAEGTLTRTRPTKCECKNCPVCSRRAHWRTNLCAYAEIAASLPEALDAIERVRALMAEWEKHGQAPDECYFWSCVDELRAALEGKTE